MAGILKCAGETISLKSDTFQLPQGATWSATCRASMSDGNVSLDAILVKIGASATSGMDDYSLTISAPSTRTAAWNSVGGAAKVIAAEIVISDNSTPPVVAVTHSFSIQIRAPLA